MSPRPTRSTLAIARAKIQPSEHVEQSWLFQELDAMSGRYPELLLAYAVPNGGHRHKVVAAKMKAEGVKPSVPDICFPFARWPFFSLYIEMKKVGESATSQQRSYLSALFHEGHAALVCQGKDCAITVVKAYLALSRWPSDKRASAVIVPCDADREGELEKLALSHSLASAYIHRAAL